MSTRILAVALASTLAVSAVGCTVKKEEDGKAPEVTVEPGKLPKYDVDPAKVTVGADTHQVVTPTVTVGADTAKKKDKSKTTD